MRACTREMSASGSHPMPMAQTASRQTGCAAAPGMPRRCCRVRIDPPNSLSTTRDVTARPLRCCDRSVACAQRLFACDQAFIFELFGGRLGDLRDELIDSVGVRGLALAAPQQLVLR